MLPNDPFPEQSPAHYILHRGLQQQFQVVFNVFDTNDVQRGTIRHFTSFGNLGNSEWHYLQMSKKYSGEFRASNFYDYYRVISPCRQTCWKSNAISGAQAVFGVSASFVELVINFFRLYWVYDDIQPLTSSCFEWVIHPGNHFWPKGTA